jgi:hypothetical protein
VLCVFQVLCHFRYTDILSLFNTSQLNSSEKGYICKNFLVLISALLTILCLFIILRFIPFFRKSEIRSTTLIAGFAVKIVVGLLLVWIHENVYRMDDFSHDGQRFLREGEYLHAVFFQSPMDYLKLLTGIGENQYLIEHYLHMTQYWSAGDLTLINDSKNVIRLHSLIHFFSGGHRIVHIAVFSFFSFTGLIFLHKSLLSFTNFTATQLFWILFLVPSTLFWTSSMMKEPFLFLGLGLFVFGLLAHTTREARIIALFVGTVLLIGFKPYILICVILSLLVVYCHKTFFRSKWYVSVPSLVLLTVLLALIFESPREAVVHYLTRKQFDFINVGKGGLHVKADTSFYYFQPHQYGALKIQNETAELTKPVMAYTYRFGSKQSPIPVYLKPTQQSWPIVYFKPGCESYIDITPINESAIQLARNLPEALFNASLRPLPLDEGSPLKYLAFVEVWIVIGLAIFAFAHRRKLNTSEKNLIFGLIIFATILLMLIGWTTPVIGAIARYRFPAQLAIIICSLIIVDSKAWRTTHS